MNTAKGVHVTTLVESGLHASGESDGVAHQMADFFDATIPVNRLTSRLYLPLNILTFRELSKPGSVSPSLNSLEFGIGSRL